MRNYFAWQLKVREHQCFSSLVPSMRLWFSLAFRCLCFLGCLCCLSCLSFVYDPVAQAKDTLNDVATDPLVRHFITTTRVTPVYAQLPPCTGSSSTWHQCALYAFFNNSNQVRSLTIFKNGRPNGEYRSFFYNGAPMIVKHFVDGVENGERVSYSSDGYIIERTQYVDGKRNGMSLKFYSKTGHIKSRQYFKDDMRHGEGIEYYLNGKVRHVANYKYDVLDGSFESFYVNGIRLIEDHYDKGLQSGCFNKYDINGHMIVTQHYHKGKRHGVTIMYGSDLNVLFSVVFYNGTPIYGKCGGDGSDGRDLTIGELKNFAADIGYPNCEPLPDNARRHALAPFAPRFDAAKYKFHQKASDQ